MPHQLLAGVREFLAWKTRQGHACHIVREPQPEEAFPAAEAACARDVVHVEGNALRPRSIGFSAPDDCLCSEFRFFLDGVQFSHLLAYVDNVPLVHHLSAAVILHRDSSTRELHCLRWSGVCERLLIPAIYLSPDELASRGVAIADTTDKTPDAPLNAVALRALAHSKSQRLRRELEVQLIREWMKSGDEGWLLVDGPLMLLPELRDHVRIVGVVKSFAAQFFDGEEQLRIITLPEGHRTTAFQLPRGTVPLSEDGDVRRRWYSWYVRVRDPRERDADFGLLRVEAAADPSTLARADDISRWLTAERAPLSTPDPRWDNLLYPIHACERYLKSMLPERNRVHLSLR